VDRRRQQPDEARRKRIPVRGNPRSAALMCFHDQSSRSPAPASESSNGPPAHPKDQRGGSTATSVAPPLGQDRESRFSMPTPHPGVSGVARTNALLLSPGSNTAASASRGKVGYVNVCCLRLGCRGAAPSPAGRLTGRLGDQRSACVFATSRSSRKISALASGLV
jgi:hypothetical protein